MSIKKNILASYASQIYVAMIGILIMPMYIKYMGAEAYGLIGLFTTLQAIFNLLDFGLTPTVARETARLRGGATSALSYRRLFRALQLIFLGIALMGGGGLYALAGQIAEGWLNAHALSLERVKLSLELTAVGVALRWMSGLYRGCISGSECLIWLGGFNAFMATLRFLCVLPVLVWVGNSPEIFFLYQLLVALIELACLTYKAHRLLPIPALGKSIGWSPTHLFTSIKPVLKFSITIAFTSSVGILIAYADKLLVSKFLSLADYGYFTLAVSAASGVMLIAAPISSVLLPRMARLQAENDDEGLVRIYRNATQMAAVIVVPSCLVLALLADRILWVWTGDMDISIHAAPILRLYALGNGVLAITAFPYYLQYAKGDLVLHLKGNLIFAVALIPLLLWATWVHGAIGAGFGWLVLNIVYFMFWLPLVHRRFYVNLHRMWIFEDLLPIIIPTSSIAVILTYSLPLGFDRMHAFVMVIIFFFALLLIAGLSSRWMRTYLRSAPIMERLKLRV